MCQLCALNAIANKERWPRPVEDEKQGLNALVNASHDAYTQWNEAKLHNDSLSLPPPPLLELLRLLSTQIDVLETKRTAWWSSPEKRALRERLLASEEEGDAKKLADLHKVNNGTASGIQDIAAGLGRFVRWTIGISGGISELMQGWQGYDRSQVASGLPASGGSQGLKGPQVSKSAPGCKESPSCTDSSRPVKNPEAANSHPAAKSPQAVKKSEVLKKLEAASKLEARKK